MKEKLIINLIYFIVSYILIFLVYVFIINRKNKNLEKQPDMMYLCNKFKLNIKKNYNVLKWCLNFINPLIISTTFIVISNIDSLVMSLLVGFIVMFVLIYAMYEILGRILKYKETVKKKSNENKQIDNVNK